MFICAGDSRWSMWSNWSETEFDEYEDSIGHPGFNIASCQRVNRTRRRSCVDSVRLGNGVTCSGKVGITMI